MLSSSTNLGPFIGFNNNLSKEFREYGTILEYDKETTIFDSDETLKWFYIIISGKIKVYDINFETNREQTLYLLVKGDMYDLVTLLDGKEHNLAVDVLEPGKVIRFPINKIREWMKTSVEFEQLIYRYVAMQMRNIENLAIDLSLYDTKERLLKLLLKNINTIESRGVDLLDKLSHTEIANLIGTVRHIIDRHLKSLKEDGIIDSKHRKIELINAQKALDLLTSYI